MATYQDGNRRRATPNSRQAASRSAANRQCPTCQRKSALKFISEDTQFGSVCRWDDCNYSNLHQRDLVEPQPTPERRSECPMTEPVRIRLWIDTGYPGAEHADDLEAPRDEWNAMSPAERRDWLNEAATDYRNDQISHGWTIADAVDRHRHLRRPRAGAHRRRAAPPRPAPHRPPAGRRSGRPGQRRPAADRNGRGARRAAAHPPQAPPGPRRPLPGRARRPDRGHPPGRAARVDGWMGAHADQIANLPEIPDADRNTRRTR